MAAQGFVAVVGARVLPAAWAGWVAAVVRSFTAGGRGQANQFVLEVPSG